MSPAAWRWRFAPKPGGAGKIISVRMVASPRVLASRKAPESAAAIAPEIRWLGGYRSSMRGSRFATLRPLPGNRLEALKGDRGGQDSIRINQQWRIYFEWPADQTGPSNVEIVDCH
jgi:hypothetical protein